jgi:glycosyltransferase involved in cell wall biosynthesis
MRKLLFISNQYSPHVVGGAELSVQTLAEELVGRGYEVRVVSLARERRDSVDTVNGVRVYRCAVANLYTPFTGPQHPLTRSAWHAIDVFNPVMGHKLGKILDHEQPDWVSANNIAGFSTAVWSAVKSRGIGLSQVLHDYWALCPKTTMNKGGVNCTTPCTVCRAYAAPKRLASRWPDLAIGVSRYVLDRHRAHGFFPVARTAVVYNGGAFAPPPPRRQRTASEPLQIGFIGRIEQVKGIELLLQAVSRLPPERFRLRIAGRPTEPAYLEELKRRYPLPQVEYLGFVPADQLYRSVDMLVAPSLWHETLCIVVYEALGFGIPVLAARVGGIPEILEGADCGWLFQPGDVDDLEAQLRRCLDGWSDPEGLYERAIRRRAFFSPQRMADDFVSAIEGRPLARTSTELDAHDARASSAR